jgi:hypothetical protein
MSTFHRAYNGALQHAEHMADTLRLDVAIRAVSEFGVRGFTVHLASRNDSDYARAEIVRPRPRRREIDDET